MIFDNEQREPLTQSFVGIPLLLRVQALFCKPCGELLIRTLEVGCSLTGRNAIQGQLRNTLSGLTYAIKNKLAGMTFRSLDGFETL